VQLNTVQVDKAEKQKYQKELLASYQGPKLERERAEAFDSERFYKVRKVLSI